MKKLCSIILSSILTLTMLFPGSNMYVTVSAAETAPEPNAFWLYLEEDGTFGNILEDDTYRIVESEATPSVLVDEASGNTYASFNTIDNAYYEISLRHETANLGIFWDYYFNKVEGGENDLSFTWEFLVRLPEMPTEQIDLFGYFTSDTNGGFGLQVNETQGILNLGNAIESTTFHGSDATVKFAFDMQANEWYHCVLTYDHNEGKAKAFVNGEPVYNNGEAEASVNQFVAVNYRWNTTKFGCGIGTTTEAIVSEQIVNWNNDVGMYNFSTYSVSDEEAKLLWENAGTAWKLIAAATETPTEEPTVTPIPDPTESASAAGVSATPQQTENNGSHMIAILSVGFAAVLIVCGAILLFFFRKRKK